ncbi:MAG TPA: hypothetical protein PKC43_06290 [Phycisphaerales bacterium]|nr:hypothetical protein [Phycisphaerales bacterium]HMP37041.1 hypothetical protein [Phycisphaerales bacterium]
MTSAIVQIGTALVAMLAAPPLELTATFRFAPETALNTTPPGLEVIVSPASIEFTAADRSTTFRDHRLWILVRRKLGTDPGPPALDGYEEQVAELVDLVERIADSLHRAVITGAPVTDVGIDPVVDRMHLREQNQFVSIVSVTCRQRK